MSSLRSSTATFWTTVCLLLTFLPQAFGVDACGLPDRPKATHRYFGKLKSSLDKLYHLRGRAQLDRILKIEAWFEEQIKADPEYSKNPEAVTKKYDDALIDEVIEATEKMELRKGSDLIEFNEFNPKRLWLFKKQKLSIDMVLFAYTRAAPSFRQVMQRFLSKKGAIDFYSAESFLKNRKTWFQPKTKFTRWFHPSLFRPKTKISRAKVIKGGRTARTIEFALNWMSLPSDGIFAVFKRLLIPDLRMMSREEFSYHLFDLSENMMNMTNMEPGFFETLYHGLSLSYKGSKNPEISKPMWKLMAPMMKKYLDDLHTEYFASLKQVAKESGFTDPIREAGVRTKAEINLFSEKIASQKEVLDAQDAAVAKFRDEIVGEFFYQGTLLGSYLRLKKISMWMKEKLGRDVSEDELIKTPEFKQELAKISFALRFVTKTTMHAAMFYLIWIYPKMNGEKTDAEAMVDEIEESQKEIEAAGQSGKLELDPDLAQQKIDNLTLQVAEAQAKRMTLVKARQEIQSMPQPDPQNLNALDQDIARYDAAISQKNAMIEFLQRKKSEEHGLGHPAMNH